MEIKATGRTGRFLFVFDEESGLLRKFEAQFSELCQDKVKYLKKMLPFNLGQLVKWHQAHWKLEDETGKVPFVIFWDLYAKKVNRLDAQKAWEKLTATQQKELLAILPEYNQLQTKRQYRPYPDKFIKKRMWEDEDFLEQFRKGTGDGNTFPARYDRELAKRLEPQQYIRYIAHLKSLGMVVKKDATGKIIDVS